MAIEIMLTETSIKQYGYRNNATETSIKHYGYRNNANRNLYKTLWL